MAAKEIATLVERDGMGERAAQSAEFYSRGGDYIVDNSQAKFGSNENIPRQQQVGMLGDRARQRVFDGDDGGGHGILFYAIKNFGRSGARNYGAAGKHVLRGFVAERSAFPLDRDFERGSFGFHDKQGSWKKPAVQITPQEARHAVGSKIVIVIFRSIQGEFWRQAKR
jgi:hypothetical protein